MIAQIKKYVSISLFIVLLLVIAMFGYNYITYGFVLPYVKIQGDSMIPTFTPGEYLKIISMDKTNISIGSVIVYRPLGDIKYSMVAHRVIAITSDGYITKGDNNALPDNQLGGMAGHNVSKSWIYAVVESSSDYMSLI